MPTKKKAASKKAPASVKVREIASADTKHSPFQVSLPDADIYYANERRLREAKRK